jgi:hypothetical protein
VWRVAQPAGDFVQAEPHEGQAATEPTDVRLAYDRDALYIGVVCHDATPSGLIISDIRKDLAMVLNHQIGVRFPVPLPFMFQRR